MIQTRRSLLKTVPALAGASLLRASDRSPDVPELQFPKEPRARLAVTSYPFREFIQSPTNSGYDPSKPGMDLKDFPGFVVKRFGVHNINPLSSHFRSTDRGYLDEFREAVERAGSHMAGLGLSGGSFYDSDTSKRKAAVDYGRKWIDIAVIVKSPSVRQHISGHRGSKPDPALAAESLGEMANYGSKRNIIVNLENDNPVAEDPFFLVDVIERVNSPYLRALPDFGNSLAGHDAAYNERAVTAMFKHAYSMAHVKDSVREQGELYRVDLGKMFAIAKASGYRGYFSMEYDTGSGDPLEGTKKLVEESLKYLS